MIAVSGIEAAEMAVTDAVDAANLGFMADDAAMAGMAKLNPEAPMLLVPSRSHLFYCMDYTSKVRLSVLTTFTGTTCNSGNTSWQTQTDSSQLLLVRSNCCKLQSLGCSGLRSSQASAGMKLKTSAGVPTRLCSNLSMQALAISPCAAGAWRATSLHVTILCWTGAMASGPTDVSMLFCHMHLLVMRTATLHWRPKKLR